MKIQSKSNNNKMQSGQKVNKIGSYLYKNIDGAFKFEKSPNMYDIYMVVYYQLPVESRRKPEDDELHEMIIDINVTTYQNKIRVNTIEQDENERTLGFKVYSDDKVENLEELRRVVLKTVKMQLEKAYKDYDFIF